MQRLCGNKADLGTFSERGKVRASYVASLYATSSVARDDRDGCSRYRASKMSCMG